MSVRRPTQSLDDLLAHAGWLNRLARHLVRDQDLAEDAVQEAWTSASRSPPDADRPPRPWFAEVLRNAIRMRARSDRRRDRWEKAAGASASRAVASPEAVYEQLELHRIVVESVMKLDEPLQATILLRYFEERSSYEVGRLMDVPAGTVRRRLKTAIERLRLELDRRFGSRREWAVLLAPTVVKGVVLMAKSKSSLAALAILVSLLGGGAWLARWKTPAKQVLSSDENRASPRSGWTLPPTVVARPGSIQGRVRAPGGAAVAGASVTLIPSAPDPDRPAGVIAETRSDRAGGFRFDQLRPGTYAVVAMAEGWAPGRKGGMSVQAGGVVETDVLLGSGGLVLSGRVLDAGGGVVGRASLTAVLTRSSERNATNAYVLRTVSDDEGAYRLFARTGAFNVRVEASGYAPVDTWVSLQDSRTRDFELTPAARVTGRVLTRASRSPVSDAEVLLAAPDGNYPLRIEPIHTDEAGRFTFASVEAGRYAASARRGRLVSAPLDLTVSAADQAEVEILVDPGTTVAGRVLDDGGQPAPGALVLLTRSMSLFAEPSLKARSEANGRYRIDGVLPGRYTARAVQKILPSMDSTAVVVAGADLDNVDLRIERQATIEGRVLTRNGEPVADVNVSVLSDDQRPGRRTMFNMNNVTGDDGRFRTLTVPAKIQVRVQSSEHGGAFEDLGIVRPGETKQVTLRMEPAGSARISGSVSDADGKPLEGVPVSAYGARFRSSGGRTDRTGQFSLTGLSEGEVRVSAISDEDSRHVGAWNEARVTVTLAAGEHRRDVALTLPARGHIAGRVLDPDGAPAAGVSVFAAFEDQGRPISTAKRATAGSDGAFVIEGLPRAKHTLWAIHDAFPDAELPGVEVGTSDALIRFRPGATLSGIVVDDEGHPIPDSLVTARARDRGRRGVPHPSQQVHDPNGAFHLGRLRPGSYTLEAVTAAGQRADLEITLSEGETRQGLRLIVVAGITVAGRVVDFDTGAPIAGAEGRANLTMGSDTTRTDAQGAFELRNIPRGSRLALFFSAAGYTSADLAVNVARPGTPSEPVVVRLIHGKDGDPRRGTVGLDVEPMDSVFRVKSVRPSAAKASVAPGDTLLAVNGKDIQGVGLAPLRDRLLSGDPGSQITLRLRAPDGQVRDVPLPLDPPTPPKN